MNTPACKTQQLASSQMCEIEHCADCGLIHLSFGPVTLRFSLEQYKQLTHDMSRGLFQLKMEENLSVGMPAGKLHS